MFIAVFLVIVRKETHTLMGKGSDNFAFRRIQTFEGNGYALVMGFPDGGGGPQAVCGGSKDFLGALEQI